LSLRQLEVLDLDSIKKIDETSKDILIKIGLKIPNRKILGILNDFGAKVDLKKNHVKFTEEIIKIGLGDIKKCNSEYILYGTNKNSKVFFSKGFTNFQSSAGQFAVIDLKNNKRHISGLEDLIDGVKLADHLNNIDIVGAFSVPQEVEAKKRDIVSCYNILKNTRKPFALWINSGDSARKIISMLEVVRGSKKELQKYPLCYAFVETITPLQYTPENLDILFEFAKYGLPIGFGPMAMTFATAPGTLAGTIVLENAEILSGIIIARLINKDTPICYWGIQHIMDLKTGNISFGSPEQILMGLASIQLANYYGFPVGTNTGLSDSIFSDVQSGVEKGITASIATLAGANIHGHQGICGADQGASLVQLYIDNEIIGYIKRIKRGFIVNEKTLLFEEIKEKGIGGNYLSSESTLANLKKEAWIPDIFNRLNWESSKDKEKRVVIEADCRVKKILDSKKEECFISKNIENELLKIINL